MKRKILSVLLCAAMVASLAVGCGGKGDDSKSDSKGGKKLVYWAMWSEEEPQAKVIKSAIEKYTKDTGVEVDVQFKGRNGQREGLQPALDAKQTIDLFDEDVNRVNGSWGKYLLDLEDLAKDYEAEHGNETLFKIARNAYGQTHDGDETLHSIPYQPSIFGFFYNKTLFDKAGIEAIPTTWEELDAACAKLKDAGIVPITGDTTYMTSFMGYHLGRYLGQDGVKALVGDPAVADKVKSGDIDKVSWDDEKVVQAAKDIEDFASKGYFSENIASNIYPAGQNQEFAPGEAAIIICGTWLPNEIKGGAEKSGDDKVEVSSDLTWGYFNYPSVTDGKDDNTANNIANQVMAINKDSKMSKEAFELITYITTGDADKQMTTDALCIPADKANADSWPEELTEAKAGFDATATFYDWAVGIENNGDLTPVLSENIVKLMAGDIKADEFIKSCKSASGN